VSLAFAWDWHVVPPTFLGNGKCDMLGRAFFWLAPPLFSAALAYAAGAQLSYTAFLSPLMLRWGVEESSPLGRAARNCQKGQLQDEQNLIPLLDILRFGRQHRPAEPRR
jgi:hypothetical protein